MVLKFSLNGQNCGDLKTFQFVKILILRIILKKTTNCKKKSKNKKILRIRMLVNTGPVDMCDENIDPLPHVHARLKIYWFKSFINYK